MNATALTPRRLDTSTPHRIRPHGFDRLIMRLSLATLLWARRHAERTAITRDDQSRMFEQYRARQRREQEAALLFARIR